MNILLITYNWAPNNNVGVKRAIKFAKYLTKAGHNIYILTAQENAVAIDGKIIIYKIKDKQYITTFIEKMKYLLKKQKHLSDNKLNNKIIKQTNNKNPKPNSFIRDLIFFPDPYFSWAFNAYKIGLKIIKKHKINLILSTSPPITTHFLNLFLTITTKTKNIMDIRDPWAYYQHDILSKLHFILKKTKYILEKILLLNSSKSSTISLSLKKFYQKYFKISKNRINVIYNCFDNDLINKEIKIIPNENMILKFIYTGKIHRENQNPEILFKALYELKKESRIDTNLIKFKFFMYGYYSPDLVYFANKYNIKELIEINNMIPYKQTLEEIANANICIIFDWTQKNDPIGKGVMPVKFYDYLSLTKPILLVNAQKNGDLQKILSKTGLGYISYSLDDLKQNILTIYNDFYNKRNIKIKPNHTFIEKFSCDYQITYKFNKIIKTLN